MLIGGIDIGGTKLGACVGRLDDAGGITVLDAVTQATEPHEPASAGLDSIAAELTRLAGAQSEPLGGVGVSCPGPYDRSTRTLLDLPNMPGWQHFALGEWADDRFSVPTRIMNDANAGALAEYRFGGFGTPHVLVFLTMSTGLGAGIVIEGRVFEGRRGFAGEVGRVELTERGPVGFGAFGTAEGYASGPGLVQLARAECLRLEQIGITSELDPARMDARDVCEAAKRGDPAATAVVEESATQLGRLIGTLANVLEPDVVVLGTIGMRNRDLFIPTATDAAKACCHAEVAGSLRIEASRLENRWQLQCLAVAPIPSAQM